MGNENFNSTSSYEKSFTSVGFGWGKFKAGVAYSDTCYALSVGASFGVSKFLPGWGISKTYYDKIYEAKL